MHPHDAQQLARDLAQRGVHPAARGPWQLTLERAETLASLRCYASTCEDAERCRPQGDAFVACRDELQNEE